mmetsp:Transcript_28005/g.39854  ORF Transcript_28005/g.39854 Transcript_28005/m.39854 type:complete len:189 (+) Transcript_28005:64-630(+)
MFYVSFQIILILSVIGSTIQQVRTSNLRVVANSDQENIHFLAQTPTLKPTSPTIKPTKKTTTSISTAAPTTKTSAAPTANPTKNPSTPPATTDNRSKSSKLPVSPINAPAPSKPSMDEKQTKNKPPTTNPSFSPIVTTKATAPVVTKHQSTKTPISDTTDCPTPTSKKTKGLSPPFNDPKQKTPPQRT